MTQKWRSRWQLAGPPETLFPGVGDTLLSSRWGPRAYQSSARRAEGLQAASPPSWGRPCAPRPHPVHGWLSALTSEPPGREGGEPGSSSRYLGLPDPSPRPGQCSLRAHSHSAATSNGSSAARPAGGQLLFCGARGVSQEPPPAMECVHLPGGSPCLSRGGGSCSSVRMCLPHVPVPTPHGHHQHSKGTRARPLSPEASAGQVGREGWRDGETEDDNKRGAGGGGSQEQKDTGTNFQSETPGP